MRYEKLSNQFYDNPLISLSNFPLADNKSYLSRLFSEWSKNKKLILLRRGMWLLNNKRALQTTPIQYIANQLYQPSYISFEQALSFYGLIPEGVSINTSATTKKTYKIQNSLGQFNYYHLKSDLYFGFSFIPLQDYQVLFAKKEKALLDFLYLKSFSNKLNASYIESLRLQNLDSINIQTLKTYLKKFNRPVLKQICDGMIVPLCEEKWKGIK